MTAASETKALHLYAYNHQHVLPGFKKTGFFLKSPTQWVLLGFLEKQEK